MKLEETRRGSILVLRLSGDLDQTELPTIDGRVATHLKEGVKHIVFDLEAVSLLPSTAVGVLIQVNRRVRDLGGRLALASVPPLVRGTLSTMGVDALFRSYADVETAVEALEARDA